MTFNSRDLPSLDELPKILSYLPNNDRELWFKTFAILGRAYDRNDRVFAVAQTWSATFANRKDSDAAQERVEFYKSSLRDGANIGSLIYEAKSRGYHPVSTVRKDVVYDNDTPVRFDLTKSKITIRKQDVDSAQGKNLYAHIEEQAAMIMNFLIVSATKYERATFLANNVRDIRFFPPVHRKYMEALAEYCRTHSDFSMLDLRTWMTVTGKNPNDAELDDIIAKGVCISFDTCTDIMAQLKEDASCLMCNEWSKQLGELSKSGNFEGMRSMIVAMNGSLQTNSNYEVIAMSDMPKLIALSCAERMDPNLRLQSYVPSGIKELDEDFFGWRRGEVSIVAAHSGVGKTWFGVDCSLRTLLNKQRVLFVSTEMSSQSISERFFRDGMQIDDNTFDLPTTVAEYLHINATLMAMCNSRLLLMSGRGISIDDICGEVSRLVYQGGVDLVVVDYLQNVMNEGYGSRNTANWERVNNTMRRLTELAAKTNCAVLALAQLNNPNRAGRSTSQTQGVFRAPNLYDLSDSTGVIKDAAVVALLYKMEKQKVNDQDQKKQDRVTENVWGEAHLDETDTNPDASPDTDKKEEVVFRLDVVKSRYGSGSAPILNLSRSKGGGFVSDKTQSACIRTAKSREIIEEMAKENSKED